MSNSDAHKPFLTAEWRNLVMANFTVPAELVQPFVPAGLELDDYRGATYVSLVGFQFLHTRVWGLPVPFHGNFPEVNLRCYVRRKVGTEARRGVVFLREIVSRPAITWGARWFYNEPYQTLPMQADVPPGDPRTIAYRWRFRGTWCALQATIAGSPQPLREGSLEQFIAEHYWGYGRRRDGRLVEYQVAHPTWSSWQPQDFAVRGNFAALYGEEIGKVLETERPHVLVADGSPIAVYPPSHR